MLFDCGCVCVLKALHRAAALGHIEVVKVLLNAGASPRQRDMGGETALHKACQNGHKDVAQILVDRAPDLREMGDVGGRVPVLPE